MDPKPPPRNAYRIDDREMVRIVTTALNVGIEAATSFYFGEIVPDKKPPLEAVDDLAQKTIAVLHRNMRVIADPTKQPPPPKIELTDSEIN